MRILTKSRKNMLSNSMKRTILIADDHPIFRQGIKSILDGIEWIKVVAEAESGDSALTQIKYLQPEIALLDLAMPGMDGLNVLERAKQSNADLIVVIITSYDDSAYLDRAFELGASAYLLKDSVSENLVSCLEAVNRGDRYISASLGSQAIKLPSMNKPSTQSLEILTQMERKVLTQVANFLTSKEIARKLDISYRTVQNHRSNICSKLNLSGTNQLLSFAKEHSQELEE